MPFYGVRSGRTIGVLTTWSECEKAVKGFAGAQFKKFSTYDEAKDFSEGRSLKRKHSSTSSDPDRVVVYTDGACVGPLDSRQAGYGVYWGSGHPWNVAERLPGIQTNNRAEIEATIAAVMQAKAGGIKRITIATDSKFTQKCATEWGPIWEKNGWKLADGRDAKLREPVQRLLDTIRDSGVDVAWMHVPGHQGVEGNEAADRLANEGAKKRRR
ncbi:unnamed protein product [Calicophoron daubneyi]|uniref:ribonuclease H n=1 Tax=Calicophoron daubneyi TaxID=300641 RepID=A0AAV2TKG2_CALDB